jgi:hypothetical protein
MRPRTAPIFVALREAAQADQDCAALFTDITNRRAANMLKLAPDLRSTGELRLELSDRYVADVIWATAGFEHYAQLVAGREWTPEEFGEYLRELWGGCSWPATDSGAHARPSARCELLAMWDPGGTAIRDSPDLPPSRREDHVQHRNRRPRHQHPTEHPVCRAQQYAADEQCREDKRRGETANGAVDGS